MKHNFKYLIFDFDGTLADTRAVYALSFNKIHARFDLPKVNQKDWAKFQSSSMKDLCREYNIGPVKLLKIAKALNKEIGPLITRTKFYPNIEKTLFKLKENYQLGILSSNELDNIKAFFEEKNLPLNKIFSFWRCEKNLFGKDRVLKSLIKEYQLDPKTVLYFGDQVRDIEACQRAGVQVAAVSWGFAGEDLLASAQPNFLLNNPNEILDLLS
jgi:phosphoglycolate phosphatase